MGIKEESLSLCLSESGCKELPRAFNENGLDFWIKAIGCVKKCNGSVSYCMLSHRRDGMVVYDKDYGMMSPINGLLSVHPYLFLDVEKFYNPIVKTTEDNKEDLIREKFGLSRSEYKNLSKDEIRGYLIEIAIERQRRENAFLDFNGFKDFDDLCDIEANKTMNEDDLALRNERKNNMDEDGMITIVSAKDYKDDDEPDDSEFSSEHDKQSSNDVAQKSAKKEYTSEGDMITEIVSAPSTNKAPAVTPAPKKRGRPRKNPV